ncbi:MAG: signal peptidase I [Spirillospora sp.]
MRRALRRALTIATWVVVACAVGVALAVGLPHAFGFKSFTVMSGSMEPAIGTGAVVVERPIAPREARVGDVVTFKDPEGGERLITHRVKSVRLRGGTARFVTKGDANNAVERWSVPAGGSIGRVAYDVPKVGYAMAYAGGRHGRILLIALPALLLAAFEVARIWRPERDEGARGEVAT